MSQDRQSQVGLVAYGAWAVSLMVLIWARFEIGIRMLDSVMLIDCIAFVLTGAIIIIASWIEDGE